MLLPPGCSRLNSTATHTCMLRIVLVVCHLYPVHVLERYAGAGQGCGASPRSCASGFSNVYNSLLTRPEGHFGDMYADGRIIVKWIFRNTGYEGVDWIHLDSYHCALKGLGCLCRHSYTSIMLTNRRHTHTQTTPYQGNLNPTKR
jgi:hypothetical protein